MKFKVRDRITGNERTVTAKAYAAMGPKVYEKLATVNDDGTEIGAQSSPNQRTPLAQRSVKGAAPVVVSSKLVAPKPVGQTETAPENTETETNQNTEQPEPPAELKKKPGRQTGSKNKKSISSNSTADEK